MASPTYGGFHRGKGDETHNPIGTIELVLPGEGTETYARQLHLVQAGDRDTDWAIAAQSHPTLYIHSVTTPITDYLRIGGHDGTTAYIDVVGGTTLELQIAGTGEVSLTATALSPVTSDSNALGTTSLMWADAFLASGAVINFNNGDVTLTHAEAKLQIGGGDVLVANGFGIIIGHTAQVTGTALSELQVLGTAIDDASAIIGMHSADAVGGDLAFIKGRDAIGTYTTAVSNNDVVGRIVGLPADATDSQTIAAVFQMEVDDTSPATGDIGMALVISAMPGGGGALEERLRLAADGALQVNQQAANVNGLALRSSNVVSGMSTLNLGPDVATNDYFAVGKIADATGGAYITAIDESASEALHIESWGGSPASTDTTSSLAAINIFCGEHNGSNGDTNMAANSNCLAIGEIDAAGSRITRFLIKADDGEVHLGVTTLVDIAADAEDDILALRAMRRESAAGGFVNSDWETHNPYHSYSKLQEMGLVGERDKDGVFLFPLQKRIAFHEDAMWQMFTDMMDIARTLPPGAQSKLSERMQNRLALVG